MAVAVRRSECAAGDGGRRFEVSEPIQKRGKDAKGGADDAGVASVPVGAESPNPHTPGQSAVSPKLLRLGDEPGGWSGVLLARLPLSQRAISGLGAGRSGRHRDRRPGRRTHLRKRPPESTYEFWVASAAFDQPSAASSASSPRLANSSDYRAHLSPHSANYGLARRAPAGRGPSAPIVRAGRSSGMHCPVDPVANEVWCAAAVFDWGPRYSELHPRRAPGIQHCAAVHKGCHRGCSAVRAGSMSSSAQVIGS